MHPHKCVVVASVGMVEAPLATCFLLRKQVDWRIHSVSLTRLLFQTSFLVTFISKSGKLCRMWLANNEFVLLVIRTLEGNWQLLEISFFSFFLPSSFILSSFSHFPFYGVQLLISSPRSALSIKWFLKAKIPTLWRSTKQGRVDHSTVGPQIRLVKSGIKTGHWFSGLLRLELPTEGGGGGSLSLLPHPLKLIRPMIVGLTNLLKKIEKLF